MRSTLLMITRTGFHFRCLTYTFALVAICFLSGCAAVFHPITGIDAAKLDPCYSVPTRTGQKTIDLAWLRQVPPPEHLADTGDTLGVFVEGILGGIDQDPPIYLPNREVLNPGVGYPVTVHANGTITLPLIPPVYVRGMTLYQVQDAIIHAYTTGPKPLLQPEQARVLVSLHQPRTYRVLVIRQESDNRQGNLGASEAVNFEADKQGTGRVVELPAYQNDVLHALAETGGLPGLDAQNMIYVIRRGPAPALPRPLPQIPHVAPTHSGYMPIKHSGTFDPGHIRTAKWNGGENGIMPVRHYMQSGPSDRPQGRPVQQASYRSANHQMTNAVQTGHNMPPSRPVSGRYSNAYNLPSNQPNWTGGQSPTAPALPPSMPLPGPSIPFSAPQQYSESVPGSIPTVMPLQSNLPHGLGAVDWPMDAQGFEPQSVLTTGSHVVKIPIRLFPGQPIPFSSQDITLQDGDIIFIESRELEFFYTGGLLGGGQYTLPRDYDISILDAISIAETRSGQTAGNPKSIGGPSVLSQDVSVGASRAVIVRPMPEGGQMRIKVNLAEAMQDPTQQIIIKPGDRIYLRYTLAEACVAYLERHLLEGSILGASINRNN